MSEIKGAPCTRRAHFHGRVHDFRRCAPGVCTFYEPFTNAIYWEGAWGNFRVHSFMGSAQCECTNKSLISDTAIKCTLPIGLLQRLTYGMHHAPWGWGPCTLQSTGWCDGVPTLCEVGTYCRSRYSIAGVCLRLSPPYLDRASATARWLDRPALLCHSASNSGASSATYTGSELGMYKSLFLIMGLYLEHQCKQNNTWVLRPYYSMRCFTGVFYNFSSRF